MHEVYRMTRSKVKVKVTGLLKFRTVHFSKSISTAIYNGSWQMNGFFCFPSFVSQKFFLSRDLELGGVRAVSPSTKSFFPIAMKFGM